MRDSDVPVSDSSGDLTAENLVESRDCMYDGRVQCRRPRRRRRQQLEHNGVVGVHTASGECAFVEKKIPLDRVDAVGSV